MKLENEKLYDALNVGMNIYYNQFKNLKLKIDRYIFSDDDKKYLSLYLGVLHSKNVISNFCNDQNINETKEYILKEAENKLTLFLKMYEESFSEILFDKKFQTIYDYFAFLLDQKAVKVYNEFANIKIDLQDEVQKTKVKA